LKGIEQKCLLGSWMREDFIGQERVDWIGNDMLASRGLDWAFKN